MPIAISWYNDDKTIILQTFDGMWQGAEYVAFIDRMTDYLNSVDHTVHVIADFTTAQSASTHVFHAARYAHKKIPANEGTIAVVNMDRMTRALVDLLRKFATEDKDVHFVTSVAEAETALMPKLTPQESSLSD